MLRVEGPIERRRLLTTVFAASPGGSTVRGPHRGMIDTGASVSVIAGEIAGSLVLPSAGSDTVRGVTGDEHARFVRLSFGFAGAAGAPYMLGRDIVAAVRKRATDPNFLAPWDVLIGMDVLSRGVLTVDGPANRFVFEFG